MKSQIKFLWPMFAAVASLALNTVLDDKSGTVVVIGLSQQKVVIAADSRGKRESGVYDDKECKIIALGNKFVFATSGKGGFSVAGPEPRNTTILKLNTREEARQAFASIPVGSPNFLFDVAAKWGSRVANIFNQAIMLTNADAVLHGLKDGPIVRGIFVGLSPREEIVVYLETVYRQGASVSADIVPTSAGLPATMEYAASGVTDTVSELREGKSQFAVNEAAAWERDSANWGEDERDVRKAIRWADSGRVTDRWLKILLGSAMLAVLLLAG